MRPGPLRRLAAAAGLVALLPPAGLLVMGSITLVDAAVRAGATLLVVTVVGRLAGWIVGFLAAEIERAAPEEPTQAPRGSREAGAPRRRREDVPAGGAGQGAGAPRSA